MITEAMSPLDVALLPESLKVVCERLICDIVGVAVDLDRLQSDLPVLLIRSANPLLFKSFVHAVHERFPKQKLVIVSHEKDRKLIQSEVQNPHEFIPYPIEGSYQCEVAKEKMPELGARQFGAKVMLDASGMMKNLEQVLDILRWVPGSSAFVWSTLGPRMLEVPPGEVSDAAREALLAIAKWNNSKLA